ncbi:MAG: hypothetical protein GX465_16655 [Acidobacteria bacterium]|nr:MAG: hypothetical protein AO394_10480 [Candidatus Fermentibacter daniensis]NLH78660.1 hypothetical protein [Acidobacteriota bacterium]
MRPLTVVLVFLSASGAFGSSDMDIGFAESLLREGDYYRAISEYKRIIYYYPDTPEADSARIGEGRALFFAGQSGLLQQWFYALPASTPIRSGAILLTARGVLDSGMPSTAVSFLSSHADEVSETDLPEYHFLCGMAGVYEGSYEAAAESFSLVDEESTRFQASQQAILRLAEAPDEAPRSPTAAALLGIVPGLGYAYTGHYGTGLASLVVNGLLAWGAVSSFRNDNDEAGYALAIVGFGFYTGNIFGSAQSAERYNESVHGEFRSGFTY